MQALINTVTEELDRVQGKKPFIENKSIDASQDLKKAYQQWLLDQKRREDSPISHCFDGHLITEVKCRNCGKTSYTFSKFWQLSLEIKEHFGGGDLNPQ